MSSMALADEVLSQIGFYETFEELDPNPYDCHAWTGILEDIDFQLLVASDHADLVFRDGRAYRFYGVVEFQNETVH